MPNVLVVPCYLAVLWLLNSRVAISMTLAATFIGGLGYAPTGAFIQNAMPPGLRGTAQSINAFTTNFVGGIASE